MIKKICRWICLVVIVLAMIATVDFLLWRNQQIKRLEAGSSLALTSKGLVEYATAGSGPVVLVLHGTLGGYDQAQLLARMLDMPDRKLFLSHAQAIYAHHLPAGQPSRSRQMFMLPYWTNLA